jgi:heme oxygenase (mycobilin-producing)
MARSIWAGCAARASVSQVEVRAVLVVVRLRPSGGEPGAAGFLAGASDLLAVLAARPGWRSGRIGRAVDDGSLWVLVTEWDDLGAYRRALGSDDVRMRTPLLAAAVDEPTAYAVLAAAGLGAPHWPGLDTGPGTGPDTGPDTGPALTGGAG